MRNDVRDQTRIETKPEHPLLHAYRRDDDH